MEKDTKKIFKDVKFFMYSENDVVKQMLKDGGAKCEYYITELVSYIISDTCDFLQYQQALEAKIPVVTSEWVLMCVKCETLLPHTPFIPANDGLFSKVIICPSQIPSADKDSLLSMVVFHNGKFKTSLDASCTHLVIGKPFGRKYDHALKHHIKIVTPEWITDSISANQLLPEVEYEPLMPCSPSRAPLKPFNTQGNVPLTPKTVTSIASTFMTPITPGQTALSPNNNAVRSSLPNNNGAISGLPHNNGVKSGLPNKAVSEDKENTNGISQAKVPESSDILKGFIIFFTDYEERLTAETFTIWKDVIEKASGVILTTYSPEVTHVICLHQQSVVFKKALQDRKLIATAYWLNDVLVSKKLFPPQTPLHLPVPFTETIPGMKSALTTVSGFEGRERALVKHMINFLGAQYTGHMTRNHTQLVCKSPTGEKYKKAIEWGIPLVSPKWLGDMIQTGQSFPCKGKSKYAVIGASDELSINPMFSTYITDIWKGHIGDNVLEPKLKQRKLSTPPSTVKRVLFTGITGAIVHRLRQNVVKLKGELAKGVNDCTHLVASKITRTVKFLSAVSICKFLVAPAWVDDSFEAKVFLDETNYTLVDPESEDLFGFKLKRSLQRAQTRQVCKGLHFHVTPSIVPAPYAMKEIIECAGGKMAELKSIEDVKDIFVQNVEKDVTYNSYLVSCLDDKKTVE